MAPLAALVMVAVGLACLGLGRLGASAVGHARARTAADAAALAGAAGGRDEADRLAEANGARLSAFEAAGSDVRVEVVIEAPGVRTGGGRPERYRARARARWEGGPPDAPTPMAPALRAALARAEALLGRPVPVVVPAPGGPPAAGGAGGMGGGGRLGGGVGPGGPGRVGGPGGPPAPGASAHARGLAVDVTAEVADDLAAVAPDAGLCRPYPRTEPAHFELCAPAGLPRPPSG